MGTKVQKWGNSHGLRLTRHILETAQLEVGDELEIEVTDGRIIIRKAGPRFALDDLLQRLPKEFHAEEVDWGAPAGKEAW